MGAHATMKRTTNSAGTDKAKSNRLDTKHMAYASYEHGQQIHHYSRSRLEDATPYATSSQPHRTDATSTSGDTTWQRTQVQCAQRTGGTTCYHGNDRVLHASAAIAAPMSPTNRTGLDDTTCASTLRHAAGWAAIHTRCTRHHYPSSATSTDHRITRCRQRATPPPPPFHEHPHTDSHTRMRRRHSGAPAPDPTAVPCPSPNHTLHIPGPGSPR